MTPPQKRSRCRLSAMHPAEVGASLERIRTEDLAIVAAEASEVVEEP